MGKEHQMGERTKEKHHM
jgi:hypothetical protein